MSELIIKEIESLKFGTDKTAGTEAAYNEALKASVLIVKKHSKQPTLNENQQMLSGSELIGVIYSQLLEDFGFGYIEKDLWMIAENLSEKIANDQPQLNENQQIVLEWLKEIFILAGSQNPIGCVYSIHNHNRMTNPDYEKEWKAYRELTKSQETQVLQAFASWVLEQEL